MNEEINLHLLKIYFHTKLTLFIFKQKIKCTCMYADEVCKRFDLELKSYH